MQPQGDSNMVKVIEGNLFDSKAQLVVHQVNCQGVMGSGVAKQVATLYPHVEVEYRKYIRHCKKNGNKPLGTVQYVPVDNWSLIMVDTMKNTDVIEYDKEYQYICNLFGQSDYGYNGEQYTNLKALKNGLYDIKDKAKKLNAKIAMPYKIGCCRGGADWDNVVFPMIKKVFGNDIDVELWRLDKG